MEIRIPVPSDADTPKFKANLGRCLHVTAFSAFLRLFSRVLLVQLARGLTPGSAKYVPEQDCIVWRSATRVAYFACSRAFRVFCRVSAAAAAHISVRSIKQFPGQKEFLLRAHFGLPSIGAADSGPPVNAMKKPITVKFEIPYFTVSGVQVRYLKIMEKSGYQALPWVRYITQNGDYHIRTS